MQTPIRVSAGPKAIASSNHIQTGHEVLLVCCIFLTSIGTEKNPSKA